MEDCKLQPIHETIMAPQSHFEAGVSYLFVLCGSYFAHS